MGRPKTKIYAEAVISHKFFMGRLPSQWINKKERESLYLPLISHIKVLALPNPVR